MATHVMPVECDATGQMRFVGNRGLNSNRRMSIDPTETHGRNSGWLHSFDEKTRCNSEILRTGRSSGNEA